MATTQISLIREHTERIRPPRALWVPFELGRPLGVPDDEAFQIRVLLHALKLLEARSGPVLEDFPEEAPLTEHSLDGWACPIDLDTDTEGLDDEEPYTYTIKTFTYTLLPPDTTPHGSFGDEDDWMKTPIRVDGSDFNGYIIVLHVDEDDSSSMISVFLEDETPG